MKRSPGVTVPKLTPHCRLFPAVPTALRCDPLLPSLPRSGGWRENATSCRRGPFACLRNLCLKPLPRFARQGLTCPGIYVSSLYPRPFPVRGGKRTLTQSIASKSHQRPPLHTETVRPCLRRTRRAVAGGRPARESGWSSGRPQPARFGPPLLLFSHFSNPKAPGSRIRVESWL